MTDDKTPPSLDDLENRLRAARRDAGLEPVNPPPGGGGLGAEAGVGFRIAAELVAGVIFGLLAGLGLDHWLGTAPWGLIVMLLLGIAAGFMNIYRATMGAGSAAGFKQSADGRDDGK